MVGRLVSAARHEPAGSFRSFGVADSFPSHWSAQRDRSVSPIAEVPVVPQAGGGPVREA